MREPKPRDLLAVLAELGFEHGLVPRDAVEDVLRRELLSSARRVADGGHNRERRGRLHAELPEIIGLERDEHLSHACMPSATACFRPFRARHYLLSVLLCRRV